MDLDEKRFPAALRTPIQSVATSGISEGSVFHVGVV